jgi:MFS family permease
MSDGSAPRVRFLGSLTTDAWILIASNAAVGLCYTGVLSVILNLFLLRLGYGVEAIGGLTSVGAITVAVLGFPAGMLGVRFGTRRSFILAFGMAIVGTLLMPLALPAQEPLRFGMLMAGRIVLFAGGTFFLVTLNPLLASATTAENRNRAFAVNAAAGSIGGILGSAAAGALPGAFSLLMGIGLASPVPFAGTVGLTVVFYIAIFIFTFRLHAERHAGERETDTRQKKTPAGFIAVMALMQFLLGAGVGATSFFTVYLDSVLQLRTAVIGIIMSASSVASACSVAFMPLIASRFGKSRAIFIGAVCVALGIGIVASHRDWISASAGWFVYGASYTIMASTLAVYMMENVPARVRVLLSGAANAANSIGTGIAALAGGFLIKGIGFGRYHLLGSCAFLMAALVFGVHSLRKKARSAGAPTAIRPGLS